MTLQILSFLTLISLLSLSVCENSFSYSLTDIIVIPPSMSIDLSNALVTSQTEFIDQGKILIQQKFWQSPVQSVSLFYNILYFNMENQQGRLCYFNYFNSSTSLANVTNCSSIGRGVNDGGNISCMNYTNCSSQDFWYQLDLKEVLYRQNIIVVQNQNPNSQLFLTTSTKIQIQNSNSWFYASVASTCFLLLSLVLLTGVVLYWFLNYRKAQRALEEMKLTEVDSDISSVRKSMRQSLMKND